MAARASKSSSSKAALVRWSEVELAYKDWNYDQQGLTQAGAALVSIAVIACTGGMGAGLVGGTAATTTSAATVAGSTTLAAMANNGGDIGKTLQALGSDQSIKSLLTGMATGVQAIGDASGCAPGAAGAVVGEMAAERYNRDGRKSDADTLNVATTMAAVAGVGRMRRRSMWPVARGRTRLKTITLSMCKQRQCKRSLTPANQALVVAPTKLQGE